MAINMAQDDAHKHEYLDSLVDEAHAHKLELSGHIDRIKSKKDDLTPEDISNLHHYENAHKGIDDDINHLLNASEENVPYSYKEHYRQKYLKQPDMQGPTKPAEAEEPSSLSKMLHGAWEGTKDTAKMAVQHPQRLGAHINQGLHEFASLPFRAVEGMAMGEKGRFPGPLSHKTDIEERRAKVKQGDIEAGVDPDSTGGHVGEAVGSMIMPVGPTLKAGKHLGNILKGAGFAGGINAAEQLAAKGDIEAKEVVPSALAGGLTTGGLSILFARGRGSIPAVSTTPEAVPKPTRLLEAPIKPGEVRGGTVYGGAPPGGIAGEGRPIRDVTPAPAAEAATAPTSGLKKMLRVKPAEGPVIEAKGKVVPNEPSPNVLPIAKEPGALAKVMQRPIEGLPPGSTEVSASNFHANLRKVWQSPDGTFYATKGPDVKSGFINSKESPAIFQRRTMEILDKPAVAAKPGPKMLTPEEAIQMAKDMDTHAAVAAKEATLKDVISGKVDANKVPMKRGAKSKGPKSEAPAPAVKGEVGALKEIGAELTEPHVGDVTEVRIPNETLHPEVVRRIEGAKASVSKVQKTIDDAKARLAARPTDEAIASPGDVKFFGEPEAKPKGDWFERTLAAQKKARGIVEPVEGEAAAISKSAESKLAQPIKNQAQPINSQAQAQTTTKEVPIEKSKLELPRTRTEDFIKTQGYKVRTREPFPGQKEYDLIDPKSGNIVARGDREQLTHSLGQLPAAKGIKLYSFPGDLDEFATHFKGLLRKAGSRVPEGVEVENMPHKAGTINTILRPLETPEFNLRKAPAGRAITDAGRDADRGVVAKVHDLIHTPRETPSGTAYQATKLKTYFELADDARKPVDNVLVLGDKAGETYTPEQLMKHGLDHHQVTAYQGVREALDTVKGWVREIGGDLSEFESKIEGYIPRVWKGDWEIFVNGNKYLKPETQTSSFMTLSDAAAEAYKLKAAGGKVSIKFFPDPEYLSSHGLTDARAIAKVKSNLERMGYMASDAIDEAFKMGKSVKGFSKHLLERKDATGYETQDLHKILNSYFYQAARRVEMQKLKDVAETVLKSSKTDLSAGQVRYIQQYVERVAGKPAWDEIAIHQFVQDTPIGKWIDPVRGGKLIASGKDLVTHLTLGFGNVGWAMINLDGLTRHVWPLLANEAKMVGETSAFGAEKYMLHGIKQFFSDKPLRQMLAHNGIIDIQMMSEQIPKIGHAFGEGKWTPQKMSMLLGTATEEFSRGVAAIARYQMALDHGANKQQAMQAAARFVEQTLGRYSRGGRPPAFTGAIGGTVGLFKTYMSVMLQNGVRALESKDVGTIARYITGAVGVSGLLGLVPGIEDMDSALTKHTGWSPIEAMEKNLPPAVTTGLLSLAGVDISRRAGIPEILPNDLRGWSGPVIGRFATTLSDIANGEYQEAVYDMLPNSIRNVLAVARGAEKGVIMGRLDKPSYKATPKEAALHAIGITPSGEAEQSRLYQRNLHKEEYRDNTLKGLTRKIVGGKASEEDQAKFRELGGRHQRLRNEQRRQEETLVERQGHHLSRMLRREQGS